MEEHCGQQEAWAKRSRGKRVEAGVIANREPLDSVKNGEGEKTEDDGTIYKICKIRWIDLTQSNGSWGECDLCNDYMCLKCYNVEELNANDDYYCSVCSN